MIDFLLRWVVRIHIERDRPLPAWLGRRLKRSPKLRRYAQDYRGLLLQLRNDAEDWSADASVSEPSLQASSRLQNILSACMRVDDSSDWVSDPQTKKNRASQIPVRINWIPASIGSAALVVVMVGVAWQAIEQRRAEENARRVLGQSLQHAISQVESSLAALDPSRSTPIQWVDDQSEALEKATSRLGDQVNDFLIERAEQTGTSVGRSLLAFAELARSQ